MAGFTHLQKTLILCGRMEYWRGTGTTGILVAETIYPKWVFQDVLLQFQYPGLENPLR